MALLFADGFEDGTSAWSLENTMSLGTGRSGNGLTGRSVGRAQVGVTTTFGPLIVGVAYKIDDAVASNIMEFGDLGPYGLIVGRGVAGEIVVSCQNQFPAILGSSAPGVIPPSAWCYVEAKVFLSDTVGTVAVRVNGVQVLNLSNVDTLDNVNMTGITYIRLAYANISPSPAFAWFDDFYLCNTTGTVNNDFLGEISVEHLRPASDDTAQWLGSDSNSVNNWDLVNEPGAFDGADYVASSTVGQRDLYVPTPSTRPTSSPVVGVIVNAVAMKTDAGTRTVKLECKEGAGGTVRQSADLGLPTSFGEIRAIFERKGDGSQFTVADVNALRFGVEVST
jgi:hypothetical protein